MPEEPAESKLKQAKKKKKIRCISQLLHYLNFLEPYRLCKVIKNLRDATGKLLKTICSPQVLQNYDAHELTCKNNGMQVARVDKLSVQISILNFTNAVYFTNLPGTIFVEERLGKGFCGSVTNSFTLKANDYRVTRTLCNENRWGYCEFKQPRG